MRDHTRPALIATTGATFIAAVLGQAAPAGDFEWVGGESQQWFDEENWLEDGQPAEDAPGCGDAIGANAVLPSDAGTVILQCSGSSSVTVGSIEAGNPLQIPVLVTIGGDSCLTDPVSTNFFGLVINAVVRIDGTNGVFDRGVITGSGQIVNEGTFTLAGPTGPQLRIDYSNEGTTHQTGPVLMTKEADGDDPRIFNSGLWIGCASIIKGSTADPRFVNEGGQVVNQLGPGVLRFSVPMDMDDGTVHAMGGNIRFDRGGTHVAGTYQADKGYEIFFTAQPGSTPVEIIGPVNASGEGEVRLETEIVVADNGTLTTSIGEAAPNGFFINTNGRLTVDGSFSNTGKMTWIAGHIGGDSDAIENGPGGTVLLLDGGNGDPTIDDLTTVTNRGTWHHATESMLNSGAQLLVTSGGTLHLISGRVKGLGEVVVEDGGLVLRPIEAGDGMSEVATRCDVTNGQVIAEIGELRFTGGGFWSSSTVEAQSGSTLALRNDDYSWQSVNPNGDGEILVSNATLEVPGNETVTNLVGNRNDGVFRLGDSGGGTLDGGGTFRNQGELRWKAGSISIGFIDDGPEGGSQEFVGGLENMDGGRFETEGANNKIFGNLYNMGGHVELAHNVQVSGDGILWHQSGSLKQVSSVVTLDGAFPSARLDGGEWELNGTSTVNGNGPFHFRGGTLRKTGAGTSVVSADISITTTLTTPKVIVEAGTLVLPSIDDIGGLADWTIAGGGRLDLGPTSFIAGQDPNTGVIGEIQGVLNLAAGPQDPATLQADTVVMGGRIRPGGVDATAELVFEADLEMQPEGILSVNVAGTAPGATHDLLSIAGIASLDGLLRVNLIDGFEPAVGQSFVVATATGGFEGAFAEVNGDGLWSAQTFGNELIVTCDALPTCAGDLGNDGDVGGADLGLLLGAWGFAPSHPADFNGDDFVDGADLGLLLGAWGSCD